MSDTVDDLGFYTEQLLMKSKTNPLRQRMQVFVSNHEANQDLKQVRKEASEGKSLPDIVIQDREERL